MRPLLLASSSPYRRELLARLQLPFEHAAPAIDETAKPREDAEALVKRLAESKARAACGGRQGLIIGSDQVAVLDGEIIGKPLTMQRARAQLMAASGRRVDFLTGIALLDIELNSLQLDCIRFSVHFRALTPSTIERYLEAEAPLDCAGSFKAEGLGISLFERTEGDDATSLIGLPLIRLVTMLNEAGIGVP